MANEVKYELATGESWTFRNPTVTVTSAPVIHKWGYKRATLRRSFTVRALLLATNGDTLQSLEEEAREILSTPRGTFTWIDANSNLILEARPTKEARWGPYPSNFSFKRFYGVNSGILTWQLETEQAFEETDVDIEPDVAEFAYTVSTSVDQNYYSVRTISGALRLNAAVLNFDAFSGADCYRDWITTNICGTPDGWQRVAQKYDMSSDGLTLAFAVTDQQRFAVFPEDITDGDATITVDGEPAVNSVFNFSLRGFYEAPVDKPDAPLNAFADLAFRLFDERYDTEGFLIRKLNLQRDLYRARIAFHLRWEVIVPPKEILDATVPGAPFLSIQTANYMTSLLTRANSWLQTYKNTVAPFRGPYGTTGIMGWCGTGSPVAPKLLPRWSEGGGTGESLTGDEVENHIALNTQAAYTAYWHQNHSYRINTGLKNIPSKGGDDIMQKIRKATCYLIVTGEARSAYLSSPFPALPYPPAEVLVSGGARQVQNPEWFDAGGAYLIDAQYDVSSPEPGPRQHSAWRYVLKLKEVPNTLKFPFSPYVRMPTDNIDGEHLLTAAENYLEE